MRGLPGVLAAALGVITPSFLLILLLASLLQNFAHVALVGHAFAAIRVAVAALILQAVYRLYKNGVEDKPSLAIFIAALIIGLVNIVNPILVIVAAAAAGIAVQAIRKRRRGRGV